MLNKINFNKTFLIKQNIRHYFYLMRIYLVKRDYFNAIDSMDKILYYITPNYAKNNHFIITLAKHALFIKCFDEDEKLDLSIIIKGICLSKIHHYYLLLYSFIYNDISLFDKTLNHYRHLFTKDKLFSIIINSHIIYYINLRILKQINKTCENSIIDIESINISTNDRISFLIKAINDKHFNAKILYDEQKVNVLKHHGYKLNYSSVKQNMNISTDNSFN